MQIREVAAKTNGDYAHDVVARGRGLFQSKETRDAVYYLLVNTYGRDRVKRSSITGQNLHPEYVTDYVGTLETGFGNTQYMTYWSKLYSVEVTR